MWVGSDIHVHDNSIFGSGKRNKNSIVIHLASPYPNSTPKDVENELIRPAVEGFYFKAIFFK